MDPPSAVVFDLDGTLIDSLPDIAAAANHALVSLGRPPLPEGVIARFVGDGAKTLLARAADLIEGSPDLDVLLARFLDYYEAHPIDRTTWKDGALACLEDLEAMPGVALAICTNKPRRTTNAVLGALGVLPRFRAIVAGGDLPAKKPAPEPLLEVGRQLGAPPAELVMVGDSWQDVECGRRAKTRTVAYEGGFSPRARLEAAGPDVLLGDLRDLPNVIRRWRGATRRISTRRPAS